MRYAIWFWLWLGWAVGYGIHVAHPDFGFDRTPPQIDASCPTISSATPILRWDLPNGTQVFARVAYIEDRIEWQYVLPGSNSQCAELEPGGMPGAPGGAGGWQFGVIYDGEILAVGW